MAGKHPVLDLARPTRTPFLQGQFWFIAKNILGWLLILSSPVIGIAIPGPGGIPIFLVGFALATIPGKRKMTSHVMRGRPIEVNPTLFIGLITFVSVAASTAIIWYFSARFKQIVEVLNLTSDEKGRYIAMVVGLCLIAVIVAWVGIRLGVVALNIFLRTLPKARRFIRPWLKKYGIALLPRRRKVLADDGTHTNENEILEFSPDAHRNFKSAGFWLMNWARRAAAIGITLYIFFAILKPVVTQWDQTRRSLGEIHPRDLLVSTLMFAIFLGVPRAMSWHSIIRGFGYRLRRATALRVWIVSELTRYLPGGIWQVVSRVRMVRPYGIRGSVCSTSQVLELAIFLLANLALAIASLCFLGIKHVDGPARGWLIVALCLLPLLALLLHPRVFYGAADRLLKKLGRPPIANRLSLAHLLKLLIVALTGLLWQSAALWILLHGPLDLALSDWWILAGAYALAWSAGFIAVWAPGGLGIREIVFIGALGVALPTQLREHISFTGSGADPTLEAVAVLTRLWTIAAELLLACAALLIDVRGVVRDPGGPARVEAEEPLNLRSD